MNRRLLNVVGKLLISPVTAAVIGASLVFIWHSLGNRTSVEGQTDPIAAKSVARRAAPVPQLRRVSAQQASATAATKPTGVGRAPPDPPALHNELLALQQVLDTRAQPALENEYRLTEGLVRRHAVGQRWPASDPADLQAQLTAGARELGDLESFLEEMRSQDSTGQMNTVLGDTTALSRLNSNLQALAGASGEERVALARQAIADANDVREWMLECQQRIDDPAVRVARAEGDGPDQ
jgi:hypothetical protein